MRRIIDDRLVNAEILPLDLCFGGTRANLLKCGGAPTNPAGVTLVNINQTTKHVPGAVNIVTITFAAQTVSMVRTSSSVATAGLEIFDFPEGWISMDSCVVQGLTVGLTAADSINLVGSVGSATPAADATLTGSEADYVASTALTLASNVATFNGAPLASTTSHNFDGSATAKKMFLNFASSGDIVSTRNITLTGTIRFRWSLLGDY